MAMKHFLVTAIAIALLSGAASLNAQSGYDLFQKALATERADGNLRDAIQMYERVVKQFASDRPLVARALIRIAECQEKLGQRDAAKVYERIVREFADQADSAGVARARLTALQSPIPPAVQAVRKIWSGGEVDAMGAPSADGRYLSFTNWTTGDLGLRDLVEGTSRLLTNTGGWETSGDYAESSVPSADARQIAYAWFVDKGGDPAAKCRCRYELRVMSIAGADAGKPRVFLRSESPTHWVQPVAWMPDNKGLIVLRADVPRSYEMGVLNLANGEFRVLRSAGTEPPSRLSLSPDGRFVALDAFAARDRTSRDIVIVSVADGAEVTIVDNPAHDYSPMFSLDGSQLLFFSDRTGINSLWRQPMSGGKPAGPPVLVASVTPNAHMLGTTRNGAAYYWTGGPNSNVYRAELNADLTARAAPVLNIERFLNTNSTPAFSADGQYLAYSSRRGSGQTGAGTTLVIRTLATNLDRDIPMNLSPNSGVSWFPDNRSLLAVMRDLEQTRLNYHQVDVATGEHRLLTSTQGRGIPMSRPLVSPDGKAIYFIDRIEREPVTTVLARFDIASRTTTALKRLTGDEYLTSLGISPDGADLAYIRFEGPSRWSIVEVMPAGGGAAREIFRDKNTGPARFSGVAWSRDKRYVLIVRDNELGAKGGEPGGSIWKVPASGGAAEPTGIAMTGMVRFPTIDPTGRQLAFAAAGGAETAVWAIENFMPRK